MSEDTTLATGLYLARVTIEAASPLSVGSGDAGGHDVAIVRDGNGWPMIAGTSVEGLLKVLAKRATPGAADLFGKAQRRDTTPARLMFSDARVHCSRNTAVSGLTLTDPDDPSDPLLDKLAADDPLLRDHVALDHRGTASDGAKFDRTAVPRGTRFSFEVAMWGSEEDRTVFVAALGLVHHPMFRPGGASARGYGKVVIEQASYSFWPDVTTVGVDIRKIRKRPASDHAALTIAIDAPSFTDFEIKTFKLTPSGLWRAGGEGAAAPKKSTEIDQIDGYHPAERNRDKTVDAAFTREPWIGWVGHTGRWHPADDDSGADYVLLGASIRGALAHRAVFHWNKAQGHFVTDTTTPKTVEDWAQRSAELATLLGAAKANGSGNRSVIIVDDIVFTPKKVLALDHNSIDRFSGGVRNGVLFSEELVVSGNITLSYIIDRTTIDPAALAAWDAAVADLCTGRLALGAKSYGYFTGVAA